MLARYRAHHPGSSLAQLLFYDAVRLSAKCCIRVCFRLRWRGVEYVPREGAVLLIANHQSFLDPPTIGSIIGHRQCDFLARSGLFKFRPFGWFIGNLHASPIKQGAGDAGAMKATIEKLNHGKMMLVFPEGSRSPDGKMHEFQRGVGVLLKRVDYAVVPVGIAGAHDAWPRHRRFPRLFTRRIAVAYGPPIPSSVLMESGVDDAIAQLTHEVSMLVRQAEGLRRKR